MAELADEALLPTQAAAEDVRAGKLDHLGQEGGQLPVNHLQEGRRGELSLWEDGPATFYDQTSAIWCRVDLGFDWKNIKIPSRYHKEKNNHSH